MNVSVLEYSVVEASELTELIALVNERLQAGWQLHGGLTCCAYFDSEPGYMNPHHSIYQALVRPHDIQL